MVRSALLLAVGAAGLVSTPANAWYRHHYRHHHYRHFYYSYYSPYRYSYAYPAYAYSYPVYYSYPTYYAYPAYRYPSYGISIGFGDYRYRRW